MKKIIFTISGLVVLMVNLSVFAGDIKDTRHLEIAEVRQVFDGDTIQVYTGGEAFSIRLYGIDCMETSPIHRAYHQAYDNKTTIENIINQGNLAAKILKEIIEKNNNKVYFRTIGIDHYGRLLAIIYDMRKSNINNMLLKNPYCVPFDFVLN